MKFDLTELFSKKHFLLNHNKPQRFTQGRWQKENKVSFTYLSFKVLVSGYLVLAYVIGHVEYAVRPSRNYCHDLLDTQKNISDNLSEKNGTKNDFLSLDDNCEISSSRYFWIYFTNWSFTVLVISFLFDSVLVTLRFMKEKKSIERQRKYGDKLIIPRYKVFHMGLRISWILSSIAYPVALFITLLYWIVLHKPLRNPLRIYSNMNLHAIQTIVAISDTLISSRPWKVGHFYCVFLYSILYLLFQILYIVGFKGQDEYGNDYVYFILKWDSETGIAVLIAISLLIAGIISHMFICLIAYSRDKVWLCMNRRSQYGDVFLVQENDKSCRRYESHANTKTSQSTVTREGSNSAMLNMPIL